MERELIVTLLKKNIDDLILLTEGFEEMNTYPRALIHLAQLKTNDIKEYLYELGEWKPAVTHLHERTPAKDEKLEAQSAQIEVLPVKNETPAELPSEPTYITEYFPAGLNDSPVELPTERADITEYFPAGLNDSPTERTDPPVENETEETLLVETTELHLDDKLLHSTEMLVPDSEQSESSDEAETETIQQSIDEAEPVTAAEEDATEIEPEKAALTSESGTENFAFFHEENPEKIKTETGTISGAVTQEDEKKQVTLGEKISMGMVRNEIHANNDSARLSNTLGQPKIDDIRQAISIGDRFRFQRELFRNNGEEMNKMLNYINLLASFQEIESFLQKKYGWAADNQAAKDLYAIARRKFL